MATIVIPILGISTYPDNSGECWLEPYGILASNDAWNYGVFRFGASNAAQPTVRHGLYGQFRVPQNYVTSAVIVPVWTATVTTGDVVWDFDYRTVGGDDTTSLDQAGVEESVSVTDASPTAAHRRLTASLSLTSGNLAAGETVQFYLARDGTDASDTMAGSAILHGLYFQYSDT
jgi:hypothetical protein